MRWMPIWVLCSVVVACADEQPNTDEAVPPLPTVPTLDAGGCGLEDYAWQPFAEVGQIVSWERAPDLELTASAIKVTLELAGIPSDLLPITYDVRTYRVRYTTQDRGQTIESTMLVSYPEGLGEVPTLLWLHGTTGFTDACAPSALGIEGGAFNLLFSSLGLVVVAPDYIGMNGFGEPAGQLHPYVVAEPTAVASLDALRAAWTLPEIDSSITSPATQQTIVFGASEGGFAAFWTERYASQYLPEAELAGVIASVPPVDLRALTTHALTVPGETTAALAGAMTTWADWYRIEQPLNQVLTDDLAASLPPLLAEECDAGSAVDGLEDIDDLYQTTFIDAYLNQDMDSFETWQCIIEQNTLLTSAIPRTSNTPFLYVVAGEDTLVAAEPTRSAFAPLCDSGYQMNYIECEGASHTEGAAMSIPQQWEWLQDRLSGEPLQDICVQHPAIECAIEGL